MEKTIVLVSYGTAESKAWEASVGRLKAEIEMQYGQWTIAEALTGRRVIEKWRQAGRDVRNETEVLEWLQKEGCQRVILLPTHLTEGREFDKVQAAVKEKQAAFNQLQIGQPLLAEPTMRLRLARAIEEEAAVQAGETLVLVGHGTLTEANCVYRQLEENLEDIAAGPVCVTTLQDGDSWKERIPTKKICLIPLLLTAGRHALQDIVGDQEESIKSQMTAAGFTVRTIEKGLAESAAVRAIYKDQIAELIKKTE